MMEYLRKPPVIFLMVLLMAILIIGSLSGRGPDVGARLSHIDQLIAEDDLDGADREIGNLVNQTKDNRAELNLVVKKSSFLDQIKKSKSDFETANKWFDEFYYELAIGYYKKVIPEDTLRYGTAQARVSEAQRLGIEKYLIEASDLYNKQKYEDALDKIQWILSVDPNNEQAKQVVGIYRAEVKKIEVAEAAAAQAYQKEKAEAAAAKAKSEGVRIGMTQEQVRASSWGNPQSINKTTTSYGVREQWVYHNYNYLYFENGILTTIQN